MYESGKLAVINIDDIFPNRFQPRLKFDEDKLEELSESIRKYGVIQPIVVRPINGKYEIIAGERRYKASVMAGRTTIPAVIVNLSDRDSEEIALLENVQRQQLSPIEEAVSYKRILDMGYITQEELAKKLGKSQSTIANKVRLLNLDDEVQEALLENKISERHARSLLRLNNKADQVKMLHRIIDERLTVKQTDNEIVKLKEEKNNQVQTDNNNIESLFDDERGNNMMDIDKIMREAQDINAPAEEHKDISQLMKQDANTPVSPIITSPEPTPEPVREDGKFVNFSKIPENVSTTPTPTPVNAGVTFDSMFKKEPNIQSVSTPSESEQQASTQTQSSNGIGMAVADALKRFNQPNGFAEGNSNNISSVSNTSSEPVNTVPNVNNVQPSFTAQPVNEVQAEPVNMVPNMSNVQPNFTAQPVNEVQVEPVNMVPNMSNVQPNFTAQPVNEVQVEPVNMVPNMSNVQPNFTAQSVNEIQAEPVNMALNVNNVQPNFTAQPVNEVQAEPVNTVPNVNNVQPNFTAQPVNEVQAEPVNMAPNMNNVQPSFTQQVNNTDSISYVDNIPNTDIYQETNDIAGSETMASSIPTPVKAAPGPQTNQPFIQVVKLIRDCANQIGQCGYKINLDELDLGNKYQVTFTIDKE